MPDDLPAPNPTAAHPDVAITRDLPPFIPTDRALHAPTKDREPVDHRAILERRLREADARIIELHAALTRTEAERDRARDAGTDAEEILENTTAALAAAGHQSAVHGPPILISQLAADRDRYRDEAQQLGALLDQTCAARDRARTDRNRAGAEIQRLRGVVQRQAEQIQRDGTTLVALREHDEQRDRLAEQRDRIWAQHDLTSDGPTPAASVPVAGAPETEMLRAERDALRVELGRALERSHAEPTHPDDVPIAHQWSVRYPDGFVDGSSFTEAGARQRASELGGEVVYRAVCPWVAAAPATIAAERPADPDAGGDMPDGGESISAGRDPEPQTADEGDEWDALDRAFAPVLAQAFAAMTDPAAYHMTRGTGPGDLEANCPCGKAPCGYVDSTKTEASCDQHPAERARSMRSMHRADQCPAEQSREG